MDTKVTEYPRAAASRSMPTIRVMREYELEDRVITPIMLLRPVTRALAVAFLR
ncbi:hypothetical protein D9M71_796260 [compost metagenome]